MNRIIRRCGLALIAALAPSLARGQAPPAPTVVRPAEATVTVGDLLVGVGAGAIILGNPSFSGTGVLGQVPLTASGRLSFKPGPAVTAFASYEIIPHFGIEGQIGYSSINVDRFEGNLAAPGAGALNGAFPIKGHVGTIAGFTNAVFTPLTDRHQVFPYLGAGIGFTSSWVDLESVNVLGAAVPLGATSSRTSFAFDAFIGADYRVSERGNIGLVYQFSRSNPSGLGSTDTFAAKTGALNAHLIAALFEYRF